MTVDKEPTSVPAWVVDDPDGRKVIVDLEQVMGDQWEYNGIGDVVGSMITVLLWPLDVAGKPVEPPSEPPGPEDSQGVDGGEPL
jgi:hypothetical protein